MLRTPSLTAQMDGSPRGVARGVPAVRKRKERNPIVLPAALFGVTLLLIVAHFAKLAELVFLAGSLSVAFVLYRRSPTHYISFVCWLFFLSPLLRRLADFMSGSFNNTSPIMVAPLAAVSLCGLSLVRNLDSLGQRRAMPFVLAVIAMLYAFVIGMTEVGIAAALFAFINWIFPLLVAFHISVTWRHYPEYHRVMLKTWVYGGLVMGAYGVWQYVQPPAWDAFWLLQTKMVASGKPEPYALRIWSTMNSTGPFAMTIMYVLQMAFATRGRLRILMAIVAVPALLFTSVRSCWGGLLIGLAYPLLSLDGKSRRRLIAGVLGVAVLCTPLMMVDQVSNSLAKRFQTFDDISSDNSYRSRVMLYEWLLPTMLDNIAGQGIGSTGGAMKLSADGNSPAGGPAFDSGVMELPYVMGWPGTLLYVGGVMMLMWRAFKATRLLPNDRFAICGFGVSLSIFCMMVMVNTLVSFSGMLFFIGVMMPLIGLRHAREQAGVKSARAVSAAGRPAAGSRAVSATVPRAAKGTA
ncbi:O-antigen ligase family protein [Paraburkholderia sp. J67]|uniref:O-antigen ligase family protein n=1 Tax=Paraburkholderia sp. J67 TaxID=2805435 RepID=UPI002ABD4C08|nr:O-antigen ligase family protein [Paraburkholderia sp. J67]